MHTDDTRTNLSTNFEKHEAGYAAQKELRRKSCLVSRTVSSSEHVRLVAGWAILVLIAKGTTGAQRDVTVQHGTCQEIMSLRVREWRGHLQWGC